MLCIQHGTIFSTDNYSLAVEVNSDLGVTIEGDNIDAANGIMSLFFNGECDATSAEVLLGRIYLHITSDTVSINDITNDMFSLNTNSDYYLGIVTNDAPDGEYTNELNLYQSTGFKESGEKTQLDATTDLTYTLPDPRVYDGTATTVEVTAPTGAGAVTVKYYKVGEDGTVATEGTETAPSDAGTYTVKVSVAEGDTYAALAETELGIFTITKADLVAGDFTVTDLNNKEYDGSEKTVTVALNLGDGKTGAGNITGVKYYNAEGTEVSAPTDYGTYTVKVNVDEGTNYNAATELDLGNFSITKAHLKDEDIEFTAPNPNVYDGTAKTASVAIKSTVVGAGNITAIEYYKNGAKVESAINAGEYTVKVNISEGTNYASETERVVGTFTILKADLTINDLDITGVPATKDYNGEASSASASVKEGITGTGTVSVRYTDEEGNTASAPTNVGEYNVLISVAEGENYNELAETNVGKITINKITLTVADLTYTLPDPRTYDGTATTVEVTAPTGAGAVTVKYYDAIGAEVTNPTNAGTYTVKVSVVEGENYTALAETELGNFTITKATLTADDFDKTIPANKEYDGNQSIASASVKTTVVGAGTTITVKYYKDGEEGTTTAPTAYGTYTVKVNINEGTNYNAADGSEGKPEIVLGSFSITKKQLDTSKITCAKEETYDGAEKSVVVADLAFADGLQASDVGTITITYYKDGEEVTNPTNAGTYTVKITTTGGNYAAITEPVAIGTLTINKRAVTVKIGDASSVYGEEYNGAETTVTEGSVITGDDLEIRLTKADGKNVGDYAITGTATNTNYDVTFENGTYTITAREITVTIDDKTSVYGETIVDLTSSVTAGSLATGDELASIVRLTKADGLDAGTYDIIGEATSTNYNVTFKNSDETKESGTYTITKATLTADDFDKTIPANKEYDGNPSIATASVKTTVVGAGTTVTVKYYKDGEEGTTTAPTAYGTYTVKVNINEGTNYNAADGSEGKPEIVLGSFSITKKQLDTSKITCAKEETYDGAEKSVAVADLEFADGLQASDVGTITITYYKDREEVTNPTNAGTYTVKITTTGGNYAAITEPVVIGTLTITPRAVTVTIDNKTSVYGETLETVTSNVTAGTIVAGDDLGINVTKVDGTNVGTYAITGTATNTNYNVTFTNSDGTKESGLYTITAREITVTIDDKTSVYGETIVDLTSSVTTGSLATGDELASIVSLTKAEGLDAGEYAITGTKTSTNYNVTFENGTYTITKATPNKTITDITIKYGETLAGKLPTATDGTFTWDADEAEQYTVGEYDFTATFEPTDTTNYNNQTNIPVKVIVEQARPDYTVPTGLEGYEGQALSTIDITAYTGFTWTNSAEILPQISSNGTTYNTRMTFTPTDTINYKTIENIPVTVTVKENEVLGIRISHEPTKTEYFEGETFDKTGMVVEANYAIGGWTTVTDYTIDKTSALTTLDDKITVTFEEKEAYQPITVNPDYIRGITVNGPTTLTYNYGDAINLTNATITKVWASGIAHANDTIPMDKNMLSNADITSFDNMNTLGTKQITVTYETIEKTNAFQITINDYVSSIQIKDKTRLQTEYVYGDTINVTDKDTGADLYILVKYAGGTPDEEVKLTTTMVSGFNMNTVADNQTVTVTYEEKTDSYTINVKDVVVGIDITKEPSKKVYKINEIPNFSDIEVRNVMKSGLTGSKLTTSEYSISTVSTATEGEKDVTVTKIGTSFTDTFKVKVIDATTDMYISKLPKQTYKYGEALDLTGGEITVVTQANEDGTVIPMTNAKVKVTGYNANKLGDQTLTVTYTYSEDSDTGMITKTLTDTYTVTVEDYWTGKIEITALPNKLAYKYGEDIDLTGGKIAKIMASGAKEDEVELSGEMISGYDKTKVGTQTIAVSNWGKTATFNVTVVDELIGISMNTNPNKTEYTKGQNLNLTGATINVTSLSGTKVVSITSNMISGYNPNKTGVQVITVTYSGKTTQFTVNVKPATVKPVTPTKPTTPVTPSTPVVESKATFTVTFVDYDGTILKTEEVESGKSATAPELEDRIGYKFLEWSEDFSEVKEDITIIATYEEIIRAKVITDGDIIIELGEELDLDGVILVLYDEEGNEIDRIPVTMDMISGFNPEKTGTQTLTVTYVSEDGEEYTDTFKIKVKKPVETLGVKDEVVEKDCNINDIVAPIAVGTGILALLLLLIAWLTRKNVEIYALTEEERKLIGKAEINKKNTRIELDKYEKQLENANIEIVLKEKITKKLDDKTVDVVFKGKKATYKVKYEEDKEFSIKMKNA